MRPAVLSLVGGYVDLRGRRVVRGDEAQPLTGQEAALLARLADAPGRCVAREVLLVDVLGYHPDVQTRALDAAVRRLRLKIEVDPAQPRHLLTVRGAGYVFQPLTARPAPTLVGRRASLAALEAAGDGLLTLVGPAGVGKTALARAWAAEPTPIVELSAARDGGGLLHRVADALGLAPAQGPEDELRADIGHALAARGAGALVLDGGEHLLDPLRAACAAWRAAAPDTTLLLTSREALGLPGERVLAVPPLPIDDAVHLLRLRAAEERVELRDEAALVALVERLDRLPLAIEIAAGRDAAPDLTRRDPGVVVGPVDPRRAPHPERGGALRRAVRPRRAGGGGG